MNKTLLSRDHLEIDTRNIEIQNSPAPEWAIFDCFSSLEIHSNKSGFLFLAQKMMEMANSNPGDDLWLPIDTKFKEMGPPMFVLKMAGKK